MKRFLRRLLLSVLVIVLSAVLVLYLTLHASLPQLDGEIAVANISADIRLERDAAGVSTVIAENRADLAFGTGFAHGQDRFFQMDLTRRRAAGELSELIGPATLEIDKRNRMHRFRSRATSALSQLEAEDREILEAYVAGVNAGLQSLGAKPFEYFALRVTPEPWTSEDVLLVAYAMFMVLNDEHAMRDIKRGLVHRVASSEFYEWLYPDGTRWDAPILGDARAATAIPSADQLDLRERSLSLDRLPADEEAQSPFFGSNNWAVSGKISRTGRAIVANDMHLGLSVPNVYYRLRLILNGDVERIVSGVTLPGTPVIVAGSNGRVAWGFTNSYGDWSDAVLLKSGRRADSYLTPKGELTVERHIEQIRIKGEPPSELVVRETIWGPILDDHDYPNAEIAVSWLAHKAEAVNMRHLRLELADTVFDAIEIANGMGMPPQNFVAGDSEGNIAWTIAGKIPVRSDYDPWLPADWSENEGWTGWLNPGEYPHVINPDSGRIWTANARVVDDDALNKIGDGGYDLGARAQQIRDDLFAREMFEPGDMLEIQTDDRAVFLAPWRDLLLSVLNDEAIRGDADRREYRDLVKAWLPRASTDSVGYRFVRAFRTQVRMIVFNALMMPIREAYENPIDLRMSNQFEGPLWAIMEERPPHLLPADFASWDELLLQAVDRNVEFFTANFEGGLAQRSWGERNTAAIQHPLSGQVPKLSDWLDMPSEPLNGDSNMPKAQGRNWGASERFAVSPGDEANGYLHMPAGQSGHPLSDFYAAGHHHWVKGHPTDFLPGESEHVLTLVAQ